MFIYVVLDKYNEIVGIYSTEDRAKEEVEKYTCKDLYHIWEWEVDNEENYSIVK